MSLPRALSAALRRGIVVSLLASSFAATSVVAAEAEPVTDSLIGASNTVWRYSDNYTDLVQTIGSDESSRNFTWYTNVDTEQVLQYAPAISGISFPAGQTTTVAATGEETTSGEYNRRATVENLAENSTYVYRVGSAEGGWSDIHRITTRSFTGDYSFLFFGDPQVGASGNLTSDEAGWNDTIDVALETYPDSELIFSSGDQVNTASNEAEYATYLSPSAMANLPSVPVTGNHDVGSKAYEQHYTVPNLDPEAGKMSSSTASGGDYWFEYKDVLYVVLNSNSSDYASHIDFMTSVVKEHGADATWKVLAFHHSIYSVASHVSSDQVKDLRATLPETISDLGFDLVLQGHDHSYTRTYLIKDGKLADASEVPGQSEVTAGKGEVLYITANSASGSKYYEVKDPSAWYGSVINQEKVRNYTSIEVTDTSITIRTLRSQAFGDEKPVNSVVDKVTLKREDVTAPTLTVPENTVITEGDSFDPMTGISANDDVDGDLAGSVTIRGSVDTTTPDEYTLTYRVHDAAGNAAEAVRAVAVQARAASTTQPTMPVTDTSKVTADGTLSDTGDSATAMFVAASVLLLLGGSVLIGFRHGRKDA